jgi:hypothetical protein
MRQPRISIRRTPAVERALEIARQRWPEEKRDSRLVALIATEAAEKIEADAAAREQMRREAERLANDPVDLAAIAAIRRDLGFQVD